MHSKNQRGYQCVYAYRLALARGTCDEKVRHFGQVGTVHLSNGCFTESDGEFYVGIVVLRTSDDATEAYQRRFKVWYFNPYGSFTWYRRLNANGRGFQSQCNIVCQCVNLRDFDAACRYEFVLCYHRSRLNSKILNFYSKRFELVLENLCIGFQFIVIHRYLIRTFYEQR